MPYLFSANSWARFRYLLKKVARVDGKHETRGSPRSSFLYPIITFQCSNYLPQPTYSPRSRPNYSLGVLAGLITVPFIFAFPWQEECHATTPGTKRCVRPQLNGENTGQILSTSTETYLFRGMRRWAQASLNARSICALSISSLVVFNSAWIQRQGRRNCR